MKADIPVPGSTKGRLVEAALHLFERDGYAGTSVGEVAAKASVTTGALYHHFGSKHGLYTSVRGDLEARLTDRMVGAAEGAGGTGRPAVRAALLVAFDAAVRFGAPRVLGERPPAEDGDGVLAAGGDPIEQVLRPLLEPEQRPAARILAAAWRAALLAAADGETHTRVRAALASLLPDGTGQAPT